MPTRPRVLIVECMQEISSFNPVPSQYENFRIERDEEMLPQEGMNTALAGALQVLRAADMEPVFAISAGAGSAGILSAAGWSRLSTEVLAAVAAGAQTGIDGVY